MVPACILTMACPPPGRRTVKKRLLSSLTSWVFFRKQTITISQGPNIWDMSSSPHCSITPVTCPSPLICFSSSSSAVTSTKETHATSFLCSSSPPPSPQKVPFHHAAAPPPPPSQVEPYLCFLVITSIQALSQ